jgi:hypothetical protein
MKIDPLNRFGTLPTDAKRTDAASKGDSASNAGSAGLRTDVDSGDTLELSAAAVVPSSEAIPDVDLSAEQLRSVTARLASGHYNSTEAIDQLAATLAGHPDLQSGGAS